MVEVCDEGRGDFFKQVIEGVPPLRESVRRAISNLPYRGIGFSRVAYQ